MGTSWKFAEQSRGTVFGGSLARQQQRLMKTGGRLIKHPRYRWLMLAESHLTRRLFGAMAGRIAALPVPTG